MALGQFRPRYLSTWRASFGLRIGVQGALGFGFAGLGFVRLGFGVFGICRIQDSGFGDFKSLGPRDQGLNPDKIAPEGSD